MSGGYILNSFANDWYDRIHVLPATLDFGIINGSVNGSAVLWNSYLSTSALASITETSGDDVTLEGISAPASIGPLDYRTITIAIDGSGDTNVTASYNFSFTGRTDTPSLDISASRIQLWPFQPNWSSSVDVTLSFLTDITTSRSGREQRRAMRTSPRRQISFQVSLDRVQQRQLHKIVSRWQSKRMVIGDPVRRIQTSSATLAGSNVLKFSSIPSWLVVGCSVILGGDMIASIIEIDSDSGSVTTSVTYQERVATGSWVYLALTGLLQASITTTHQTSGVAELALTFDVDPGSEDLDEGSVGPYYYNNREILHIKPNWGEQVSNEYLWDREQVDYSYGRLKTYVPNEFGSITRQATFVHQGVDDIAEIQQFFTRQKGQAQEFLMPTWFHDLPPQMDLTSGSSVLRIAGLDVYNAYADDATHRAVAVITRDGRFLPRAITSITTYGSDTIIYVDNPWPTDIPLSNIMMVSWLYVARMASDDLTIEWLTNTVAQTVLSIRTLEALPSEIVISPYDEATQWFLDNFGLATSLYIMDLLDRSVNIRYPEIVYTFGDTYGFDYNQ